MISREDRYLGCLLGLAVGDALGTTLEFKPRGSFTELTDMIGGGPFKLKPGQWTDDTSMALCLAHSLLNKNGFDPIDQMNRYCNWWQLGYMSSTGECFDIGVTVSSALDKYLDTKNPFAGSIAPNSAGNGSLMRLAPVAMFFSPNYEAVIRFSGESSRTTHACAECIDACRYFGALLHLAFEGAPKSKLLQPCNYDPETKKVKEVSTGNYQSKSSSEVKGSGYVIESLEAALWSFASTTSFDEAVLTAANLGDDADTTAAICGQLAGAFYGVQGINVEWLKKITMYEEIHALATDLYSSST